MDLTWETLFDGQMDVSPPLADAQLSLTPGKRGVLLLLAQDGRPIVLLSSSDIRSRLRSRLSEVPEGERHKAADLRAITGKILWKLADGHFETDWLFFETAGAIWPDRYAGMLSWKPPWMVHVNPSEEFPHFSRENDELDEPGTYVGPFPSGASAQRFISTIEDTFSLCRDFKCLRQSPHGPRCSYGQMGRCVCPCDGTMPLDDYRLLVAQAAEFARGNRDPYRSQLQQKMADAAKALKFEQAQSAKLRLDRLTEFDRPEYEYAAPLERFRFVLVQPSGSTRKAKVFLADIHAVWPQPPLDYPLRPEQVEALAQRIRQWPSVPAAAANAVARRWRVGLIAHYLYCSSDKRGLILRADAIASADDLQAAIEAAAESLKLSKKRSPSPSPESAGDSV